jgi:ribosomal protein S18 acetylase RimI-like enzyme
VGYTIRDAVFGTPDAQAFAWALDVASDGFIAAQFGSCAREVIAAACLEHGSEFSLQHVRIAEVDGDVVGVCSSFDPHTLTRKAEDVLAAHAGLRLLRAGLVSLLARPVMRQLQWHDPGDWYVQCIAVRPPARGMGVGSALLNDARHRAIDAGAQWLTLDVDTRNDNARRIYERAGLTVVSTSRPARLLGGVRLHRMAADLLPPL